MQLSQENNSGQTGVALLTDLGNGQTRVTVTLQSVPAGASEPAHIHEGNCGPTLNPTPKYPLTNVVNGRSETTVATTLAELRSKPYALNVHKSAQESTVYVACGNITGPSLPPRTGDGGSLGSSAGHVLPATLLGAALLALALAAGTIVRRRRAA